MPLYALPEVSIKSYIYLKVISSITDLTINEILKSGLGILFQGKDYLRSTSYLFHYSTVNQKLLGGPQVDLN